MPTKRDPRTDPRPGDVIERDGLRRCVDSVFGCNIRWRRKPGAALRSCLITAWRNWAKDAAVIEPKEGDDD